MEEENIDPFLAFQKVIPISALDQLSAHYGPSVKFHSILLEYQPSRYGF